MIDIEAIKARAEAATKGPWGARELPQMVRGANATLHSAHGTGEVWSVEFSPEIGSTVSIPDAEFIAHARMDIPALVAEVERLQGIVGRVRESVHVARHALHLTGTLDPREVLQHITTAMETE